MDKSKLPKMTKGSLRIKKKRKSTKPGAADDDAKGRLTRNIAKRKRMLDQLK